MKTWNKCVSRQSGWAWVVSLVFLLCVGQAVAELPVQNLISLEGAMYAIDRLAPDVLSGTAAFQIAALEGACVRVRITTSSDGITTWIVGPNSELVDENTVGSLGGRYAAVEGGESGSGTFLLPIGGPGFHQLYEFPSFGSGVYTVHFEADPALGEEVVVMTDVTTDGPVRVNFFATQPESTVDSAAVLVAALFEGASPIPDATVTVAVTPPVGDAFALTLLDDGGDVDAVTGDGLYSGYFVTSEPGDHHAIAEITGVDSDQHPFSFQASTEVRVMDQSAAFTGTITDSAEDDNGNGLYERLVIDVEADVLEAGTYVLHVLLETPLGSTLIGHGQEELSTGLQSIGAAIRAPDIVAVGEDGPYTIKRLDLCFWGSEGSVTVARIVDGTQQTQAYLLADFERPPVRLTGVSSDAGIDDEPDGDFDTLQVLLGVDILVPGVYEYTVSLYDGCYRQIDFIHGQYVHPGAGHLELNFSGALIGANGVDGPYTVGDLILYGPGGSVVVSLVHQTQGYAAEAFDAFVPAPDCNGNDTPDLCDIVEGTSIDCNSNGVPDECDADCNDNGIADECDLVGSGLLYDPVFDFEVAAYPVAVAAGDLDGDGDGDLVVGYSEYVDYVSILLNNGDRTFASPLEAYVALVPRVVAVVDLDGDDDLDIAAAGLGWDGFDFAVLINDGTGSFAEPSTFYTTGTIPTDITVRDFDGDQDLDVAIAHLCSPPGCCGGTIAVLRNTGTAYFQELDSYDGFPFLLSITSCDLDLDGDVDLAFTAVGDPHVLILAGAGDGTFSECGAPGVGDFPWRVVAADFDGNGEVDLAASNKEDDTVSLLLNRGIHEIWGWQGFDRTDIPVGDTPYSLTAGDLDGGGDTELCVAHVGPSSAGNSLWVLRYNTETGAFGALPLVFPLAQKPSALGTGDLDADGFVDLVLTYQDDAFPDAGFVSARWNASVPPFSVDCNDNSVPDECDIASGTSTDGNGNGIPDECDPRRPMPEDCSMIPPGNRCSDVPTCTTDDDCAFESHCVPPPVGESGNGVCYAPKHRYLSIARHPAQIAFTARRVKLDTGDMLGWVGEPRLEQPAQEPDGLFVAEVVDSPHYEAAWPEVVHVTGCEIAHASLCDVSGRHCLPDNCPTGETCVPHAYHVQAIALGCDPSEENEYSDVLELHTPSTWGDTVSTCAGNECRPPDGLVGLDDIVAAINYFMGSTAIAPITWLDIDPSNGASRPDRIIGLGDILGCIAGFQGSAYPGDGPLGCP